MILPISLKASADTDMELMFSSSKAEKFGNTVAGFATYTDQRSADAMHSKLPG